LFTELAKFKVVLAELLEGQSVVVMPRNQLESSPQGNRLQQIRKIQVDLVALLESFEVQAWVEVRTATVFEIEKGRKLVVFLKVAFYT
jgi:hypothetical protein